MRKCIMVMGMHRSGTSALVGVLNLLGVFLGKKLLDPNEYNIKGYFENDYVNQFNEKLLQALNSSWDDLFFLEKDWWKKQSLGVYRNKAFEIIEQEFNGTETFYIKDPRLCILLPFWNNLFEKIGVKTSCIISLRNPLEVASSLEKRDGFSIQKGIILWMTHMLSAEFYSRCLPRVFISYYGLLNKPGNTIARISDVLHTDFPQLYEKSKKNIEQFLERDLKHFNIDDTKLEQDVIGLTYQYYNVLLKLTRENSTNDEELLEINKIRKEFDEIQNLFYNQEIKAFAGLEGVVRQKDSLLHDQVYQIQAKDSAIQEQEQQIQSKDAAIQEQEQQIQSKDAAIQEQEQQIQSKDAAIQEQEQQIDQLRSQIELLQRQIVDEKLQRYDILNSITWKLMAPLRKLKSLSVRKLKHKASMISYLFDHQFKLIKRSGLFDPFFYLERNPDVAKSGMNPLIHYIKAGAVEGRDPNLLFYTSYYLHKNSDIAESGMNPLVHYLELGTGEGRDPNPLFDTSYYLEQNPDVAESGMNPLTHYLEFGAGEGRDPNPLFDTSYYLEQNHVITELGMNPLSHYIEYGSREGRKPNPFFNTSDYVEQNPDVAESGMNPLAHYIEYGSRDEKDQVMVSIIIYASKNWHVTNKCIEYILNTIQNNYYEVIVADNYNSNELKKRAKYFKELRVITDDKGLDYLKICNKAAKIARGNYYIFLRNDTTVKKRWPDNLVGILDDDSSVGMAGSKILYSSGKLQEAGSIVWNNGRLCHYGRMKNYEMPEYNYLKDVDFVSGTSFIIRKELWDDIGGFDSRYYSDYYANADLSFEVRNRGFRVVYQPKSVAIDQKEKNNGTNGAYSLYNKIVIDRDKFVNKWSEALNKYHVDEGTHIYQARDRNQGKKTILVIDRYVPEFDMDSGSLRMFGLIKIILELGYKVIFWPESRSYHERYSWELQKLGVEVYYGEIDFEDYLKNNGKYIDLILLSRSSTAVNFIDLSKNLSNARIIYDTVDLSFLREERKAKIEGKKFGYKSKTMEFFLGNKADEILVVSSVEKQLLERKGFEGKVSVISNVHSLESCNNTFEDRAGLMFIGGFAHMPNEDGIVWFVKSVWPSVIQRLPGINLYIVGSKPTENVKLLVSGNVTVTGYVENVSSYFEQARVFVAPLRYGAGVKGKIGQSMAHGLPIVTTSIGAEGMGLTDGHNVLIADTEEQFANKIVEVYQNQNLWETLSLNARTLIEQNYTPSVIKKALHKVLEG